MPRMKHEAETAGSAPVALPLGLLLLLRFLVGVLSKRTQRRRRFPVTNFRIKSPLNSLKSSFSSVYILQEIRYCVSGLVNYFSTVPTKESKSKETVT